MTFTLGQTSSAGDFTDSGNAGFAVAQKITLSVTASLVSLSFFVTTVAGQVNLGIYSDSSGQPGALLGSTGLFTPSTGFNTKPLALASLAPGDYWLAHSPTSNGLNYQGFNTGGTNAFRSTTAGNLPNPYGTLFQPEDVFIWSYFATFDSGFDPSTASIQPEQPQARMVRRALPVSEHMAATEALLPIAAATAPTFFAPVFADAVCRPAFRADRQEATVLPPFPFDDIPAFGVTYSNAIVQPRRDVHRQQFAAWSPQQFSAAAVPLGVGATYPDKPTRPPFRPEQQDFAAQGTAPERTLPLADSHFPARVERASFRAERQLFVTELAPAPESIGPAVSVSFPDAVRRPALPPAHHPAFGTCWAPERIAPLADVSFPHVAPRAWFGLGNQLAATELPPLPVVISAAPNVTPSVFPDAPRRQPVPATAHMVTVLPPAPIAGAAFSSFQSVFPDAIPWPFFKVAQQQATPLVPALPPNPNPLTLGWGAVFADSARAARLPIADHPAFATSSAVERVAPLADASFPASIARPALALANQQATVLPPAPENTAPMVSSMFAEAVTRARLGTAQQMAFAGPSLAWFAVAPPPPYSGASFPNRVERPFLAPSEQQAFSAPSFAAWFILPPFTQASFPDRPIRAPVPGPLEFYFAPLPIPFVPPTPPITVVIGGTAQALVAGQQAEIRVSTTGMLLVGTRVRLTCRFRDFSGAPADPTAVSVTVAGGSYAPFRESTGIYHLDYITDSPGTIQVEWTGTGAIAAKARTAFFVSG